MSDYLKAVQERVVIFDGAMGTNIQLRNPSMDDFRGKEGYNDILVFSRPEYRGGLSLPNIPLRRPVGRLLYS